MTGETTDFVFFFFRKKMERYTRKANQDGDVRNKKYIFFCVSIQTGQQGHPIYIHPQDWRLCSYPHGFMSRRQIWRLSLKLKRKKDWQEVPVDRDYEHFLLPQVPNTSLRTKKIMPNPSASSTPNEVSRRWPTLYHLQDVSFSSILGLHLINAN